VLGSQAAQPDGVGAPLDSVGQFGDVPTKSKAWSGSPCASSSTARARPRRRAGSGGQEQR
jgi:hypothetical protein